MSSNKIRKALTKISNVFFWDYISYKKNSLFPAGHFYSPVISVEEIKKRQDVIWDAAKQPTIPGIDLNTESQLQRIEEFSKYYAEIPFAAKKNEATRYYFENPFFSYTDAIFLYSMMRQYKPKKIIEIGSGFSSAVMLDVNTIFFNNEIDLTFIEPYPDRLNQLLTTKDKKTTNLVEKNVQNVSLDIFEQLNAGDILFVDSSHVVKTGSDVNYIIFEILPKLKPGVIIHFHDIFYPFEYPKEWVFTKRNWNEDYFLKAFLMYNTNFSILLFSHYLHLHHPEVFSKIPLCYKNKGGNLWLLKK